MSVIIVILLCGCAGASLFLIVSACLKLPLRSKRLPTSRKAPSLDDFTMRLARKLAPLLRMKPERENLLKKLLETSRAGCTAAEYQANLYVKTALIAVIALLCGFLNKLLLLLSIAVTVLYFFKERKKPFREYERIQKSIEKEQLPFVSHINQMLPTQKDVLKLLEGYKLTDNPDFAHELEMTIADMQSGSYENGLLSLGRRVNSRQLSLVIQGLQGVLRGEDQTFYFKTLEHDLDVEERNQIHREVDRLPSKLEKYSFLLCMAFIALMMAPVVVEVSKLLQQYFK